MPTEGRGIAVEADGTLVVVDGGLQAVVRADPVSGDRTILSDASLGSGPGFVFPSDIAVEADGSLVVVDPGLGEVVRVDPVSGDRTVLQPPIPCQPDPNILCLQDDRFQVEVDWEDSQGNTGPGKPSSSPPKAATSGSSTPTTSSWS